MINKITLVEALDMFSEIFGDDISELSIGTHKNDMEGWDSMGVLLLMAEFDSRFEILFSPDQLESFTTIQDLIDILKNYL